jgi:hypothetical protein
MFIIFFPTSVLNKHMFRPIQRLLTSQLSGIQDAEEADRYGTEFIHKIKISPSVFETVSFISVPAVLSTIVSVF